MRNLWAVSPKFLWLNATTSTTAIALGGTTTADKDADGVKESYVVYDGAYALVNNQIQKDNATGVGAIHANSKNYGAYLNANELFADAEAQEEIATWDTNYWVIKDGAPAWKSIAAPSTGGDER